MAIPILQTANLEQTFQALKYQDPAKVARQDVPSAGGYKKIPNQNYAPTVATHGFNRYASAADQSSITYGQPQFF